MKLWEWLTGETSRFWATIAVGIGIGLAGAYGRERHEGRKPDRGWLLNRLLIYPFLALAASQASETFTLSRQGSAFVAAVLSMLAYDAVRAITARSLRAIETTQVPATGETIHRATVITDAADARKPETEPIAKLRDIIPLVPNTIEDAALLRRIDEKE